MCVVCVQAVTVVKSTTNKQIISKEKTQTKTYYWKASLMQQ